jgi:restriction system protein
MTYARRSARRSKAMSSSQALLLLGVLVVVGIVAAPAVNIQTTLGIVIPLLLILIVVIGIAMAELLWYSHVKTVAKLRALHLSDIDTMTGVAFEHYVGTLLEQQGYQVRFTSASNDFGVDIIAKKEKDIYAIQLKRYTGTVGRVAITDAIGGLAKYGCTRAMAITNSYFTSSAKELAAVNQCVLIDRDQLAQWILDFQHAR